MATTTTNYAGQVLTDVRRQIAVDDDILSETKARRNVVKRIARSFPGALKTFDSGSVAHGTVNKPVSDADCGFVLDRRMYPELGPDGDDEPPDDVVWNVAAHVLTGVLGEYPEATCRVCKRAILIEFQEPLGNEQDPSVDLIVALTKVDGDGRWIPNTEAHDWDASDPEQHTALLNGPDTTTRVHRARVIRLAKAAVKQDETPVVTSFNMEALALDHVDTDSTIAEGLRDLLLDGADTLHEGLTLDPAKVSDPIKLPDGIARGTAVGRLRELGDAVSRAVEAYSLEDAEDALATVYPDFIESGGGARSLGDALRLRKRTQIAAAFGAGAADLKPSRAYGDETR
jgi:hypothetical protein